MVLVMNVFLQPGTELSYVGANGPVVEVLTEETEAELVEILENGISVIKWPNSSTQTASAAEPRPQNLVNLPAGTQYLVNGVVEALEANMEALRISENQYLLPDFRLIITVVT